MRLLFIAKSAAAQLGLFDTIVPVKGGVRKDGTAVKPHFARRHKRQSVAAKPVAPRQVELFDRPREAGSSGTETAKQARQSSTPAESSSESGVTAYELGRRAFNAGLPAAPARDPEFMRTVRGPVGSNTERMRQWQAGWSAANLAAPVAAEADSAAKAPTHPPGYGVPAGTSKAERRKYNARAVELLRSQSEFSDTEKAELARYSGRGGCGDSLNEFYTRTDVAGAMWQVLANCGISAGEALEPSCGTGVFLHTAPAGVHVTGVELDATSAGIASVLNARHEVAAASLENFAVNDTRQFDAVIGNAPFGLRGTHIKDDKKDLKTAEQYFLDTAIDKTKPGGIVAMIVPSGIMDGKNNRGFRERVLRKAEFLGAMRLPNTAFEAAHTEVTTDVVLFRARPDDIAGALGAVPQAMLKDLGVWDEDFLSGAYFSGRGKDNVFGRMQAGWRAKAGMGHDITVAGSMEGVANAVSQFVTSESHAPGPTVRAVLDAAGENEQLARKIGTAALKRPYETARPGDTKIIDGETYVLEGEPPRWHRADRPDEETPAVADAHAVAGALDALFQDRDNRDAERADVIAALDAYVAAHGIPSGTKDLVRAAQHDKALWRLIGAVNKDGSYSDLVSGRVREAQDTSFDAVAARLALEQGGFTADDIAAAWTGGERDAALDQLFASANYAIEADGRTWTTLDDYLSGDLWPKLDGARAALGHEGLDQAYLDKYRAQADALEKIIDPASLEDVDITLAAGWVPLDVIAAYFNNEIADWKAKHPGASWAPPPFTIEFADGVYTLHGGMYQTKLLGTYLNRTGVRKDDWPIVERMNQAFKDWLLGCEHRDRVEDIYNRKFKGFRQKAFSDTPMEIPGLNPALDVNAYHFAGLRWALAARKGIIAADVGLGKTGRGLMLAKLAKLNGRAEKPMFVVPKSVLANWAAEAEFWFPGSRVLTIGETYSTDKDGNLVARTDGKDVRNRKFHELSQNDYDFVFMSQPVWNELDVDPITKKEYVDSDFWTQRTESLGNAGDKRRRKIEEAYQQAVAEREFGKRTEAIHFGDLDVDMLLMDEAHCFPAGTQVSGKPIESYRPGETVASFDFTRQRVVQRRVIEVMSRPVDRLCRVHFNDRDAIVCTPNHPFFVSGVGYVQAQHLGASCTIICADTRKDALKHGRHLQSMPGALCADALPAHEVARIADESGLLLTRMPRHRSCADHDAQSQAHKTLPSLRQALRAKERPALATGDRQHQGRVLRQVLRDVVETWSTCVARGNRNGQFAAAGGISTGIASAHADAQPDEQPRRTSEDDCDIAREKLAAMGAGWQRARAYGAAAVARACAWLGYGSGGASRSEQDRQAISIPHRHWQSATQDRHRGGRRQSWHAPTTANRPSQGIYVATARVARVEIFEPTSDGTFGGLCPDGLVYDLKVEDSHNYFAESLLVHNSYKNLFAARNRFGKQPKFLGGSGLSNRAQDTYFKTRALREAHENNNVYFLTATPTKNSPLEVYSMLTHIAPEEFEARGIRNSEEFLDRYCEFKSENVLTVDGKIEETAVVTGFKNLDELRDIMRRYIDRTTAEDVGLRLPERDEREHLIDMSPMQETVYAQLREQAAEAGGDRDATGDAHIFSIMEKMGKAAIDLGLLGYSGTRSPKLEKASQNIATLAREGGQVVFADHVDLHEKLADALVKRGIPRDQIAIVNAKAANTSAKRQNISDKFNAGKYRVVIGNTATMGEGINLQKATTDIHHLELPWEPASMQQRNGRGLRQGNTNKAVRIHSYLSRGSFDGYRYQTLRAKKDWQDLLWHGGNRVENLAREGAFSRDEMMIMLAANPEQARKQYEENKAAALERKRAAGVHAANDVFLKFQEMKRSHGKLKDKGTAAAIRLKNRIDRTRAKLTDDKYFTAKDALDGDAPTVVQPETGHVWRAGRAFELAGGADAPLYYSNAPSRWVVTGVDPFKGKVTARPYGVLDTARAIALDAAKMNHGVTPINYSEAAETAHIEKQAAEMVEAGAHTASDPASLRETPETVLRKLYKPVQDSLKSAAKGYKGNWGDAVGLLDKAGRAVAAKSYEFRKMADDHDIVLPLPEHREKVVQAWIDMERSKAFKGRMVQSRRRAYGGAQFSGVDAAYPDWEYGRYRANPWSLIARDLFGPELEHEARAKLKDEVTTAAAHADSFAGAMRRLAKLATVDYSGRVTFDDPHTLNAIYRQAVKHGVLDRPIKQAADVANRHITRGDQLPADFFGHYEYAVPVRRWLLNQPKASRELKERLDYDA